MPLSAPKVFLSHASEDKEQFVLPLGTALRERGVDAWLDKWEMLPGDSLVQKVFDEGIGQADIVVVVLSHVSVMKPWVREELDSAVVQRINGQVRLVPIMLDDVEVPIPLQHLFRLSVLKEGFEGVLHGLLRVAHSTTDRPPLGPPPAYAAGDWTTGLAEDPVDDTILRLLADQIRDEPLNMVRFSDDLQAAAAEQGIDADAFFESLHMLKDKRLISGKPMAGGLRWAFLDIPDATWHRLEHARGVDTSELQRRLLAHAVNVGPQFIQDFSTFGHPPRTVRAVLSALKAEGLLHFNQVGNGELSVGEATAKGRRVLRLEDDIPAGLDRARGDNH